MLKYMSGVKRYNRIRDDYVRGIKVESTGEVYFSNWAETTEINGVRWRGKQNMRWEGKLAGDLTETDCRRGEALERNLLKKRIRKCNADTI